MQSSKPWCSLTRAVCGASRSGGFSAGALSRSFVRWAFTQCSSLSRAFLLERPMLVVLGALFKTQLAGETALAVELAELLPRQGGFWRVMAVLADFFSFPHRLCSTLAGPGTPSPLGYASLGNSQSLALDVFDFPPFADNSWLFSLPPRCQTFPASRGRWQQSFLRLLLVFLGPGRMLGLFPPLADVQQPSPWTTLPTQSDSYARTRTLPHLADDFNSGPRR